MAILIVTFWGIKHMLVPKQAHVVFISPFLSLLVNESHFNHQLFKLQSSVCLGLNVECAHTSLVITDTM